MKHLKCVTHERPGVAMMGMGLLKGMMGNLGQSMDSMLRWMGSGKQLTGS